MYRDFMAALNVGDRSTLRELLTERMFSRFKAHLPDKKERRKQAAATSAVAFVTGNASIVQARAAQITGPIDTIFVQVTCDIQVLQPERSLVRVVFRRVYLTNINYIFTIIFILEVNLAIYINHHVIYSSNFNFYNY